MASFQAKICQERPRKSENNNNHSDEFLSDPGQRMPKKFKKLNNTFKNWLGMAEKERKEKKIVSMSFYPTRNREFQKKSKKFKKLKNTIMASFKAKIRWERLRKCEK